MKPNYICHCTIRTLSLLEVKMNEFGHRILGRPMGPEASTSGNIPVKPTLAPEVISTKYTNLKSKLVNKPQSRCRRAFTLVARNTRQAMKNLTLYIKIKPAKIPDSQSGAPTLQIYKRQAKWIQVSFSPRQHPRSQPSPSPSTTSPTINHINRIQNASQQQS